MLNNNSDIVVGFSYSGCSYVHRSSLQHVSDTLTLRFVCCLQSLMRCNKAYVCQGAFNTSAYTVVADNRLETNTEMLGSVFEHSILANRTSHVHLKAIPTHLRLITELERAEIRSSGTVYQVSSERHCGLLNGSSNSSFCSSSANHNSGVLVITGRC